MPLPHDGSRTNGESVVDGAVPPVVGNINHIPRLLDARKRNRIVQCPLNLLRCHTGESSVDWRCNLPLLDAHIQDIKGGSVPVVGGTGSVATEKYLPPEVALFLDVSEILLDILEVLVNKEKRRRRQSKKIKQLGEKSTIEKLDTT